MAAAAAAAAAAARASVRRFAKKGEINLSRKIASEVARRASHQKMQSRKARRTRLVFLLASRVAIDHRMRRLLYGAMRLTLFFNFRSAIIFFVIGKQYTINLEV